MDLPNKLLNYLVERDPNKRKVKPAQALFDFEDLGESSDDSDFRIEDHCDESDDSIDSNARGSQSDNDDSGDSDSSGKDEDLLALNDSESYRDILSKAENLKKFDPKNALKIMICSVCLGDRSDAANEIIECDNCSVTVHEGCYGVQDSDSVCSTDSPCPTTPWFCDACKAGFIDPICELCPNQGGIFKETDVGKWVHLVCALYIPGVAFAEVDKLQNVTLFEMAYSKWGSKPCILCTDQRFARTGVTVGCDAGLCKTYFHVTCGQKEGLLTEAHTEEVEQADPFYAHCKLHTDKNLLRKRRRNWLALQMRTDEIKKVIRDDEDYKRIQRRLGKYRNKYSNSRLGKMQPWLPTQKIARLLTTSAGACRALWRKAELSGADTEGWAMRKAQVDALTDVHRRWYIQPAFTVEFIGYFLDRNVRIQTMKKQLGELVQENSRLIEEQTVIEEKKDKVLQQNSDESKRNQDLKSTIKIYHDLILTICPKKKLPELDWLGRPVLHPMQFSQVCIPQRPGSIPAEETDNIPEAETSQEIKSVKRKREKHHRYSPEPDISRPHKHKHKRSKQQDEQRQSLKICFKSVTDPTGGSSYVATPSSNLSPSKQIAALVPPHVIEAQKIVKKKEEVPIICSTCNTVGDSSNLVRCDECLKGFHFACLDPPVKKSPKVRGYSWHCANCDPTESD